MKKYKIRVRILPENICCGFIIEGYTIYWALDILTRLINEWEFKEYEFISIGEL